MTLRRVTFALVLLAAATAPLACGSDDEDGASTTGGGASTSTTAFEDRTHDTWQDGDDAKGSISKVTGVLRAGDPAACTVIEIDGDRHPVTWPPGSTRTDEGISVGEDLYRFDEESEFTVIQDYDGPQRPVTCVTTTAWLVTR